ncbi:MAG TPA: putative quinol monooxygenase [Nitrososphaera sp.]|nr:putative quinol monooxygenase [Nitrososphaera sp.]
METTDIRKFQSRTLEAVRVLAFFKAKPGRGKELEKILQTLVALTRSELGNIAYVLHRSTTSPDALFFDEMFVSMEAFEEHTQKPYIKSLMSKIGHLVDVSLRVETYSEV